jgi:hypothetical protein
MQVNQLCFASNYLRLIIDQLAALTTFEAYCVQFSILRQARGLPPALAPPKPRWSYKTFESSLPLDLECTGSMVSFDEANIADYSVLPKRDPDLICALCVKIKAFTSIVHAWSHIQHQHKDAPEHARLAEVRRLGLSHRDTWITKSHGGRNNPTRLKLDQVLAGNFDWGVVLSWNLR